MTVNTEESKTETTLDRAKRIVNYIEELISTTGEHPECELKETWGRNTPYLKAEFIKDVQSIANSNIKVEAEKYIVIGANETSREIVGCNYSDFDDANIRQLLQSNLDSVPDFEILRLKSSKNKDFVVFRIPHQSKKPFIVKSNIFDKKQKCHLAEGQIWIKPNGSSGKQLLKSKTEILELIDIQPLVSKEVENRLDKLKSEIRLEERTRINSVGFGAIPSLTSTEEEFEFYVEQIIASNDVARFSILLQKLRDKCVESWELKIDKERIITLEEIKEEKNSIFLPSMRRLALLGILLIKYESPLDWFNKIVNLLIDIYNVSEDLKAVFPHEIREQKAESLETLFNNYIPALESLMVANLLIGFEIKKKSDVKFSSLFFPRLVKFKSTSHYSPDEQQIFYLFYRFDKQSIDQRLDFLILERYGNVGKILEFFGSEESMRKTLLQVYFLIDWLSFLSFKELESQTSKYFDDKYPQISTAFVPIYTRESLKNVVGLAEKIWTDLPLGNKNFFLLDSSLAKVFSNFNLNERKQLFARFLVKAERSHAEGMLAQKRFPFDVYWSEEINSVVQAVKQMKEN